VTKCVILRFIQDGEVKEYQIRFNDFAKDIVDDFVSGIIADVKELGGTVERSK